MENLDLTGLIGQYGFPGAAFFALVWLMAGLKKSLDANTRVLYLIAGKQGVGIGGIGEGGSQ